MEANGMDAIELLTAQHREVEALWSQLEQARAAGTEEQRDIGRRIITMLSKHDAIETQFLYPELRSIGGEGEQLADHSLEEHQKVRELLAEADRRDLGDPEAFGALGRAVEAVQHHVQEEETRVFPFLRDNCDEARLRDLGSKMAGMWDMAPTHPHPHTPDNKMGATVAGAVAGVVDKARDAVSGRSER